MLRKLLSYIGFGRTVGDSAQINGLPEAYCQACGRDVSGEGGDVSDTGRIYCHGYKPGTDNRCLDTEFVIQMRGGMFNGDTVFFGYRNAKQVQKDIKRGRLTEFGPLEKSVGVPEMSTIARTD